MNNYSIVLYTSTRGHFGYKDCYKHTVKRLEKENLDFWRIYKLAHIKISPGEEELAAEMKQWLNKKGFRVIQTKANWKHNDPNNSHAKEYYKDKLKCFSDKEIQKRRYTFFIEDDWKVNFNGYADFYLDRAAEFLDKNLDYLCVRVNNEIEKSVEKATPLTEDNLIYKQNLDYTIYGPTLTFQPTLIRSAEWRHALRLINSNLDILNTQHCELVSGMAMRQFSDSDTPFCFFNPQIINCEHIGEEEKIKNFV